MTSKVDLRKMLRAKLKALDTKQKNVWNQKFVFHLKAFLESEKISCLGVYAPLIGEIDWSSLQLEVDFAFSDFRDGKMAFYKSSLGDLVESENFGVKVKTPKLSSEEVIPSHILVPGLGFTLLGERLGRGKGFYDRYLQDFKGLKIGVCYEEQICEELPIEDFDIKMDILITERGIKSWE